MPVKLPNTNAPSQVFTEIKNDLIKEDGTPDFKAIEFWEGHMNINYLGFAKPYIDIFHQ